MYPTVDTRFPSDVEVEVQSHYLALFPNGNKAFVPTAFGWAIECFTGKYKDYQPIDALYHDFEHTLQGTLCLMRLLRGRERQAAEPRITQRLFELALVAILLHDTGYLKTSDDREGTGAKYTLTHVNRSCDFAVRLLREKGFQESEIASIQNMIRCTGVNADLKTIPFQSDLERIIGFALSTADLLGQMAAEDYVEKLPILFLEFAEAGTYTGKTGASGGFLNSDDLMRKTPGFWTFYVLPKIEKDFQGIYKYLGSPQPGTGNYYIDRIEQNLERIRKQVAALESVAAA